MKSTGIYAIRHIVSGKSYIGSAKWIENRWAVHRKQVREGTHHSPKLQNAWIKYGESEFAFDIIEETTIDLLLVREQFYLDFHRSAERNDGYNVARVAGSPRGFIHGPKMRAKLSTSLRGRKLSDEHRARISAALSGRKPTQQAKDATSRYWTGRPSKRRLFDDAHCEMIRADRRTGMLIKALAEKYGCSTQPIRHAINRTYV